MYRLIKKPCNVSLIPKSYRYKSMKCKLTKPNPTSCDPKPIKICPEKPCPPAPPCRVEKFTHIPGIRVICCPPPYAYRPPCPPIAPLCAITCDHRNMFKRKIHEKGSKRMVQQYSEEGCDLCAANIKHCGVQQTEVSIRLEKAEELRRTDYEEDARRRSLRRDEFPPKPNYQMECYRPCVKATDGKEYSVESGNMDPNCECGTKSPLCLRDVSECMARPSEYIDHCKHIPKTILEIKPRPPPVKTASQPRCVPKEDPSGQCVSCSQPVPAKYTCKDDGNVESSKQKYKKNKTESCQQPTSSISNACSQNLSASKKDQTSKQYPCKPCKPESAKPQSPCPPSSSKGSSSSGGGAECPRSCPDKQDWCANMPPINKSPDTCREPTLAESLFRRKNKGCEPEGGKKKYHTLARFRSEPLISYQQQNQVNICYSCLDISTTNVDHIAQKAQNRNMSTSAWRKLINLITSDDHSSNIPKERNLCVPKPKCPTANKSAKKPCRSAKDARVEAINPCAFHKFTGTENACMKKEDFAANSSCQCAEKVKPFNKQGKESQQSSCDLKTTCKETPKLCCGQNAAPQKPHCNAYFKMSPKSSTNKQPSSAKSTEKKENICGIVTDKSSNFCSRNKPKKPPSSDCCKKS